jgi:hypothetical protein
MTTVSVSIVTSIPIVSCILLVRSLSVASQIVIASEAWQSHKKRCFLSLKDFYVINGKDFPHEIATSLCFSQ